MNIKEAKEEIKRTLKAYTAPGPRAIPAVHQRPILLIGPPGIGKTAIMEQVARECQVGLVSYTMTHHTRQSAIGLPYILTKTYRGEERSVTEYTMSEIIASVYECMEHTGYTSGILFIDEINCVSETLSPVMLQFLQNKTFGNHPVPDNWLIVAAGNPPEYNKSVREFDIVTLDRVKYMEIQADLSVWKEYACEKGIHPAIQSYLKLHPDHFYSLEQNAVGKHFVTARGWEDLSCILYAYESLREQVVDTLFFQYLQEESIARSFAMYYRLYRNWNQSLPLEDYLEGSLSSEKQKVLKESMSHAALDEIFGITSMISDFLFRNFQDWKKEKTSLQKYRELLNDWHRSGNDLDEFCKIRLESLGVRRDKGLISIPQADWEQKILENLENLALQFRTSKIMPEDYSPRIRIFYQNMIDSFQKQTSRISGILANAYELVKDCSVPDPALLYLTTDLSKNKRAVEFLSEHPCPWYLSLCDKLLISQKEEELKQAIRNLES